METPSHRQNKICVYCGAVLDVLTGETDDHVIARSWFPRSTPPVAKWKVPACVSCNNKFSLLEEDVLRKLAMCLDPKDLDTAHIVTAALRTIDGDMASGITPKRSMTRGSS